MWFHPGFAVLRVEFILDGDIIVLNNCNNSRELQDCEKVETSGMRRHLQD